MAIGVVTINIIGTSAGALVPQAIGYAREVTGEFTAATFVISSLLRASGRIGAYAGGTVRAITGWSSR
jgi:hypothetical protein